MNKRDIAIIALVIINLIALILIKPIVPGFFLLSSAWKIAYITVMFGFPLLLILPIMAITALVARLIEAEKTVKERWIIYTRNSYLIVSGIILFINSLLLFGKYGQGQEIFPLIKYAEVQGCNENTDDLKRGSFSSEYFTMKRKDNVQIENYPNGNKVEYKIEWLSNNEYRLTPVRNRYDLPEGLQDTTYVKITKNAKRYYECYTRIGEYANYYRIDKVQ